MRNVIAFLVLILAMIAGCDGGETTTTGGAAGSGGAGAGGSGGGTTSATTSTGSTEPPPVTIGPNEGCNGDYGIGPITGQYQDENGVDIFEDGALACRKATPPYYPFTVETWTAVWGEAGPGCSGEMPTPVYFVAPSEASFPIQAEALTATGGAVSIPDRTLGASVNATLQDGEAFYGCWQLSTAGAKPNCASACRFSKVVNPPEALYSQTNAQGNVDPLPTVNLEMLSVSPTEELAAQFQAGRYDWNMTATGK